jgi:Tol biopolymer transport system component
MRVTNDLAEEDEIQWAPDRGTLYYDRHVSESWIDRLDVVTGESSRLAGWDGYQAQPPAVSPDGSTVLFVSNRSGNEDIWSVPLGGGEPTPFVASALRDHDPQFSPDGNQVLFHSNRSASMDLWVIPAEGGDARQLTDWSSYEARARWSPDGSRIAFASNRDATGMDLWIMPASGGDPTRLTTGANIVGELHWGPDGQTVYYIGTSSEGNRELYRVAPGGEQPQALGANPLIGEGVLSPDGAWFASIVFDGGYSYVEAIPTAGGEPRRVSDRTERVYQPAVSWLPSSDALVVSDYDYANDSYDVYLVSWPDGTWRALTATPDLTEWVGESAVTPDGTGVLIAVARTTSRIMSVPVGGLLMQYGSD